MRTVTVELKVLQEVGVDQHHGNIDPIGIGDDDQKQQGHYPEPALTLLHNALHVRSFGGRITNLDSSKLTR
ncbi:hypothetical protein D3C80_830240 [compost metagenome]